MILNLKCWRQDFLRGTSYDKSSINYPPNIIVVMDILTYLVKKKKKVKFSVKF